MPSLNWRAAGVRLACDVRNQRRFGCEGSHSSVEFGHKEQTYDGGYDRTACDAARDARDANVERVFLH